MIRLCLYFLFIIGFLKEELLFPLRFFIMLMIHCFHTRFTAVRRREHDHVKCFIFLFFWNTTHYCRLRVSSVRLRFVSSVVVTSSLKILMTDAQWENQFRKKNTVWVCDVRRIRYGRERHTTCNVFLTKKHHNNNLFSYWK